MNSVRYYKNVKILFNDDGKFIYKKNKKKNKDVYKYLMSRNFLFFPKVYSSISDDIEVTEYIEDIIEERNVKQEDLVNLVALLHSKTVHFRTVEKEEIKKIYEDVKDRFEYLYSYYVNIERMIQEEVYMSPSNYYFLLNISYLFTILDYGNRMIEKWYQHVKDKKTLRFVMAHRNLSFEHLLKNSNPYLISWDNADFDYISSDLESIFKNNYKEVEIDTILNLYNSKYELKEYEYELFIAKICLIKQLNFNKDESWKIVDVADINTYILKIYSYILKQNSNKTD